MTLFTLEAERWYALELVLDDNNVVNPQFMPIFVEKIIPRKTGKNRLGVAWYSSRGEAQPDLHILKRTSGYLAAESGDDNYSVIYPITFDWIARFCPDLAAQHPFPSEPRYASDLQFYLDQIFEGQVHHRALTGYAGRQLVFVSEAPVSTGGLRVKALDCPLIIEAEHLLALQEKVIQRVRFYFPNRDDLVQNISFQLEYEEHDVLTACALRFDGYKYLEHVLHGDKSVIQQCLDRGDVPENPLLQMAAFFHLQRYLMKWGGEHEPLHGRKWRLFRTLFLAVVNRPVPPEFQLPDRYAAWLHNYEPYREQCIQTVQHVHELTEYDDEALPAL